MTQKELPIWLIASGVAMIVAALVVRHAIATPTPDWETSSAYTLPIDPLGLATKWFVLGALALVGGALLRWRHRWPANHVGPVNAFAARRLALVAAFSFSLACAVELSATEWTYVAWGESRDNITPEMENNRHLLIYPMSSSAASVKIYRIISRRRSNVGLSFIAANTTAEYAGGLRDEVRAQNRKTQLRLLSAWLGWAAVLVCGALFWQSLRRNGPDPAPR